MRRLDVLERKKLRGVSRWLAAVSRWADGFEGYCWLPDEGRRYRNWRIPLTSSLVNPPKARKAVQRTCIAQMLRAARQIVGSCPVSYQGYYTVACLFVLPWLHQSEVTVFYDPDYFAGFCGGATSSSHTNYQPISASPALKVLSNEVSGLSMKRTGWTIGQPL
ncbi:MAG: DUF3916 domain-containing protein [Meiothermus sp.]|nr:DUF3916 domain-containing protein [Meiothermus sp.]